MNICVAPSKNLSKEVDHRYLIDLYEIAHHRISRLAENTFRINQIG